MWLLCILNQLSALSYTKICHLLRYASVLNVPTTKYPNIFMYECHGEVRTAIHPDMGIMNIYHHHHCARC
jgi:hypothetical protein